MTRVTSSLLANSRNHEKNLAYVMDKLRSMLKRLGIRHLQIYLDIDALLQASLLACCCSVLQKNVVDILVPLFFPSSEPLRPTIVDSTCLELDSGFHFMRF